jgi:histidinol-phosphate aminotransferase
MAKLDFSALTRPNVRSLQAYAAKDIPCRVKLDANESPYSVGNGRALLPDDVLDTLNRYPDPEARNLKKAIASTFKVSPDQILMGNGSDELIYYLVLTFGGPVLYPVPTFSMYGIITEAVGEPHVAIPLDIHFDIDLRKMLAAVRTRRPKLVFLSSPNNPTGNCFSADRMLAILEASKGLVVVDEAYLPFSDRESFLGLLGERKNLVILKTMSKIGYASLRLGFLIANAALVAQVNKVRLPYNVNALSQVITERVLRRPSLFRGHVRAIVAERKKVFKALTEIKGATPFPSETNFILFRVSSPDKIYEKLLAAGVLVRNMGGVIQDTLRVTIGTPAENRAFLSALKSALGGVS